MATEPLLEMRGITKSFPGVLALRGVDLEVRAGEVMALIGENGAGKSTLIKVLAGAHLPDQGSIRIAGQAVAIRNPLDALKHGIAVIYQELNLVPSLTVRENLFLGREQHPWGFLNTHQEQRQAKALFDRMGVVLDPEAQCRSISVAQQQLVEIAKALSGHAQVIVMDEPSATLTLSEVERLFGIIRDLKQQGIGIIYVSHRLEEIFAVADRVTVLRDGAFITTRAVADVNREQLIELLVGRKLEQEFPTRQSNLGPERLVVRQLCRRPKVNPVSFSIRRGEVLGLTGLVGAGRTEMARLIFGADPADAGTVMLDGQVLNIRCPADAIACGIGLLTEDRKSQGLIPGQSARTNFSLPNLFHFVRHGFIQHRKERTAFAGYIRLLGIRIAEQEQLARNLSGGNQQKVLIAKWLERHCEVLLFDEPTRGIDVGAKYEVYQLINQLAGQGKSILMISSELPEILGMSDRILVMRHGSIAGEIGDMARATQEQVMQLAME